MDTAYCGNLFLYADWCRILQLLSSLRASIWAWRARCFLAPRDRGITDLDLYQMQGSYSPAWAAGPCC